MKMTKITCFYFSLSSLLLGMSTIIIINVLFSSENGNFRSVETVLDILSSVCVFRLFWSKQERRF